MTRPSWDAYFLAIAQVVSSRADCTRRQVGAVLVDREHRIVATGYNGARAGQPGCASEGACPRGRLTPAELPGYAEGNHDYSDCIAVHAEVNAIRYAQFFGRDMVMYVTVKPCNDCQSAIESAGISRTVWPGGFR